MVISGMALAIALVTVLYRWLGRGYGNE